MNAFATAVPLPAGDRRITVPLFTLRECATYVHAPLSTVRALARPKDGAPLITVLPSATGRHASVPFVGFAEAFVLGALRRAGVSMPRMRGAVAKLNEELGLDHALASRRMYTDGAELIFDYASSHNRVLAKVVRTGRKHLAEVIRGRLEPITYGDDGWVARLRLPAYSQAEVTVDPTEAFGQPVVVHGGARVEDLVDRFKAGDGLAEIAADFDVPSAEVEDVVRVALRLPA